MGKVLMGISMQRHLLAIAGGPKQLRSPIKGQVRKTTG